jgi:hypothetical protein
MESNCATLFFAGGPSSCDAPARAGRALRKPAGRPGKQGPPLILKRDQGSNLRDDAVQAVLTLQDLDKLLHRILHAFPLLVTYVATSEIGRGASQ